MLRSRGGRWPCSPSATVIPPAPSGRAGTTPGQCSTPVPTPPPPPAAAPVGRAADQAETVTTVTIEDGGARTRPRSAARCGRRPCPPALAPVSASPPRWEAAGAASGRPSPAAASVPASRRVMPPPHSSDRWPHGARRPLIPAVRQGADCRVPGRVYRPSPPQENRNTGTAVPRAPRRRAPVRPVPGSMGFRGRHGTLRQVGAYVRVSVERRDGLPHSNWPRERIAVASIAPLGVGGSNPGQGHTRDLAGSLWPSRRWFAAAVPSRIFRVSPEGRYNLEILAERQAIIPLSVLPR